MIQAAFFDVDGTLVSHTYGVVPSDTRDCLEALHRRGIRIFLSTGRHVSELERLPVRDLCFDGYVTLNGQLCLDGRKRYLCGFPFSEGIAEKLAVLFREKRFPLVLTRENGLIINYINDLVCKAQAEISSPVPEIGVYDNLPIYQATTYVQHGDEKTVREWIPSGCRLARWSDKGLDLLPLEGGKARGIREILKREGIMPKEIIAFGDGENDLDMLKLAGIGVAMGNAGESVRKASDYVTADVNDDGIGKALRYFGIL